MVYTEVEKLDETLPYGTTKDDICNLIEAIKIKHGNDNGIKQVYGKPNIENSRKALKALGISLDGLTFSDEGRKYSYEIDYSKKQILLLELILQYPPYEYFLLHISHSDLSETPVEIIQNYWGQHSYGNSENNRSNASITFGQIIELAGLGNLKLGRKGKATRIEWDIDASKVIRDTHLHISSDRKYEVDNSDNIQSVEFSQLDIVSLESNPENSKFNDDLNTFSTGNSIKIDEKNQQDLLLNNKKNNYTPNINITVDMSSWNTEQIISFFKASQGIFE